MVLLAAAARGHRPEQQRAQIGIAGLTVTILVLLIVLLLVFGRELRQLLIGVLPLLYRLLWLLLGRLILLPRLALRLLAVRLLRALLGRPLPWLLLGWALLYRLLLWSLPGLLSRGLLRHRRGLLRRRPLSRGVIIRRLDTVGRGLLAPWCALLRCGCLSLRRGVVIGRLDTIGRWSGLPLLRILRVAALAARTLLAGVVDGYAIGLIGGRVGAAVVTPWGTGHIGRLHRKRRAGRTRPAATAAAVRWAISVGAGHGAGPGVRVRDRQTERGGREPQQHNDGGTGAHLAHRGGAPARVVRAVRPGPPPGQGAPPAGVRQ